MSTLTHLPQNNMIPILVNALRYKRPAESILYCVPKVIIATFKRNLRPQAFSWQQKGFCVSSCFRTMVAPALKSDWTGMRALGSFSTACWPETDETLVSSRISRESRGFQSLSLSLDLENRPPKVSVSVSVSKIGLLKSQSRSRKRRFQSLSLSLDLVNAVSPCLRTLFQNSY